MYMNRIALTAGMFSAILAACDDDATTTPADARVADAAVIDSAPMPDQMPGTPDAEPPPTPVDVTDDITSDTTWTRANIYTLKDHIFVLDTSVLTIEEGTTILGDNGSSLVVAKGSRLEAEGSAERPIVFTSSQAEGSREAGDWDFGWTGKGQFLIVQQFQTPAIGSDNGIEGDNNSSNNEALPRTNPELYNMSIVGSSMTPTGERQFGMHLKNGTAARINNLILSYVGGSIPIDVDGASAATQATAQNLVVKNSIFFMNTNQATWDDVTNNDGGFVERTHFTNAAHDNLEVDPLISAAQALGAPDFKPATGSPALVAANAATPPGGGFFDVTATFIGAVGATDWTAGWTAFPQN